jgi:CheY-like chemotaxis protein
VLLVEDDLPVRHLLVEVLSRCGCTVTEAGHGREALALRRERLADGRRYDLVVLDLDLPLLGGEECLRIMCQCDPHLRAVIITGMAISSGKRAMLLQEAKGLLIKPFPPEAFVLTVECALDAVT